MHTTLDEVIKPSIGSHHANDGRTARQAKTSFSAQELLEMILTRPSKLRFHVTLLVRVREQIVKIEAIDIKIRLKSGVEGKWRDESRLT